MINILYLITTQSKDGPGNVLINIMNNLDRSKFNPIIAYLYHKVDAKENIYNFFRSNVVCINLNMKSPLNGWLDFTVIKRIREIIKEHKIDIIHMHLHRPIIFGSLAANKINRIATIHNQEPHQIPHSLFEYVVNCLEERYLKKADVITTVSIAVKNSLLNCYQGLNETKIIPVYNGISVNKYIRNNDVLRAKYNLKKDEVLIASIARLDTQKGLEYLIDSIEILKNRGLHNFKVLIIGEGKLESKLKTRVLKKNLEEYIIFTGYIADIASKLVGIDVVVLTSIFEGLGLCLIESMAQGICCIGTNVGGIPEALGNEGIIVESRNPEVLADAISKVILDKPLRERIGEMLAKRYENLFSAEKMTRSYQNLYLNG